MRGSNYHALDYVNPAMGMMHAFEKVYCDYFCFQSSATQQM